MRKLLLIVSLLMVIGATPALAVTDGEKDGNGHPQVGLMVALNASGAPLWRCSGTLLSPTVYVTAGHCTEAPAVRATIWFDDDVESGIPGNGYPNQGEVSGTAYVHPDYDPDRFWVKDVGVVLLDEPVTGVTYGSLPEVDSLDQFAKKRGKNKAWFTAVGYGLQMSFPSAAAWKENNERVRYVAYPRLIQINTPGFTGPGSLLLSNNANTGGTCFGDSGGPNFLKDSMTVAAVTSFGVNGNCAGTGGVFRLDREDVRDWVASFLD